MELLPVIWGLIIAFCIVMYVVLDGFTLGTGILVAFMNRDERDIAVSVLLPTWDGNQTWLVLGGACLYGAFPVAFSFLLPTFYLPLMFMIIGLLLRGVSFEFRLKAVRERAWIWDSIFCSASLFVTFIQGVVVGNMAQGFDSSHAFLSLFSCFTGLSLICAYTLLGSTRLILKTMDSVQEKMFKIARVLSWIVIIAVMVVCAWSPYIHPKIYARWFNGYDWPYLFWLPLLMAILIVSQQIALFKKREFLPYWLTVAIVLGTYLGFGINLYPYAIPYHVTLWQAASAPNSLRFMLVGAVIMLPVLLIYTGYAYRIFSGKVKNALHY